LYAFNNGKSSKKYLFDKIAFPCTRFDFFVCKNILTFVYCNENKINIIKFENSEWTEPQVICDFSPLCQTEIYKIIKISENHASMIYKTNKNQTEYIEFKLDEEKISSPVLI